MGKKGRRGFGVLSMSIRTERWIAAGLAFAVMFPSLLWIMRDQHAWPWDQAWYGEVSAELFGSLIHDPALWLREMGALLPQKPPLYAWLGQFLIPLGLAIGDLDFAGLILSILAHGGALVAVYFAARRLAPESPWWAVFATVFTASGPMFVGLSHQYLVEPLQTLIVAASFLLALEALRLPLLRMATLLVLLVVAAAGVKTTTFAYCGLAWAIAGLVFLARLRHGERIVWRDGPALALAAGTLVLLAFLLVWYAHNLVPMLAHVRNSTSSQLALYYGSQGTLAAKLAFWMEAAADGLSLTWVAFPTLLAIAAVAVGFAARRAFGAGAPAQERLNATVAGAALVHVAAMLVLLSLQINEDTRFIASVLPLVPLLVVHALRRLSPKTLPIAATLLAGLQLVLVHAEAAGRIGRLSQTAWLIPVTRESGQREVAAGLAAATCPYDQRLRYVVVGIEEPALNANTLAMYSARARVSSGWRCYYTGLGYAEKDAARALARIDQLKATYVILPRADKLPENPNFLNLTVRPVFEAISRGNRYSTVPGDHGDYQVWRRADG